MSNFFKRLFSAGNDGVPRINIYLMRLVWTLILVFVGQDTWRNIAAHRGPWEPLDAVAWTVWGAFACFGLLGIFRTVQMIPLLLFEVTYKLFWLALVAYPLWSEGKLAGSPAEGLTNAFLWVVLPIAAIPWPYAFRTYLLGRKPAQSAAA